MTFKKTSVTAACILMAVLASLAQTPIRKFQSIQTTYSYGDNLLLVAHDGVTGEELWISNGTPEGTKQLKDINPGYANSGITDFFTYKNLVFFSASSPDYTAELWVTDGSVEGTRLFADIVPGNNYGQEGYPRDFIVFKDLLYFTSNDGKLFRTDGSSGNITLVDQMGYGRISNLKIVNNKLYYYKGSDILYWTDGTIKGDFDLPLDIEGTYFNRLFTAGNKLFAMRAASSNTQVKLYLLNQTNNTWTKFFDLKAPSYSSNPVSNFNVLGEKVFFTVQKNNDNAQSTDELWITDGTSAGTVMLKSFAWTWSSSESAMENFKIFNNELYFRSGEATTKALWKSDGTVSGTQQLHSVIMAKPMYQTNPPVIANTKMYFAGSTSTYTSPALWSTDGTASGTKLEIDVTSNLGGLPHHLAAVNDVVYFVTSEQFEAVLWSTAPAGEINVTNITGYNQQILTGAAVRIYGSENCNKIELRITNDGKKTLAIGEIQITGKGFYLKGNIPESLAPAASFTIEVLAYPLTAGVNNATLSVSSGDLNEGVFRIRLISEILEENFKPYCKEFGPEYSHHLAPNASAKSIVLSNSTIQELMPAGTEVGKLSLPESTPNVTYSFVAGEGDTENAFFVIDGDRLKTSRVFLYTERNFQTIRVRATLADQSVKEATFTIATLNKTQYVNSGDCEKKFQRLDYDLSDVAVNSEGKLFTITSLGDILVSADGGSSWTSTNVGIYVQLSKIFFKGTTGYILASNGLYKSDDNGASWFQVYVPLTEGYSSVSSVFFFDDKRGYVSDNYGAIFFTSDGGKRWQVRKTGFSYGSAMTNLFFVNEQVGFATNYGRSIFNTTDGGKTWTELSIPYSPYVGFVTGIYFSTGLEGFICSDQGLFRTTNGGTSWTRAMEMNANMSSIRFLNAKDGYVLGANYLWKTTDEGKTWTQVAFFPEGRLTGMALGNGKMYTTHRMGYYSDTFGRMLNVSVDNGTTWTPLIKLAAGANSAVAFPSGSIGFVCSDYGNFKTKDGGVSWKPVEWTTKMNSALFLDENTALFANNEGVYRSTDGGETIMLVFEADLEYLVYKPVGLLYRVSDNFITTYNSNTIHQSTDGGLTWSEGEPVGSDYGRAISFVTENIGYSVELFGTLSKTVDGGLSWERIYSPDPYASEVSLAISFVSEQIGFRSGDGFSKTTDGGITWTAVRAPWYKGAFALHFTDELHGFAATYGGAFFETFNAGESWTQRYTASEGFNSVRFTDTGVYFVGSKGYISHYKNTGTKPWQPGYISGENVVCAGDVQLYNLAQNSEVSYSWMSNGPVIRDYQSHAEIFFPTEGEYTLSVSANNACGVSETRSLTINAVKANVPVINGPGTVALESQTQYQIDNVDQGTMYSWVITPAVPFTTSTTTEKITVTWPAQEREQTISVISINTSGCRALSEEFDVTVAMPVVGLESETMSLSVYPNPSTGVVQITTDSPGHYVTVTDLNGKVLLKETLDSGMQHSIDIGKLAQGIYIVRVVSQDNSVSKMIVKK